MTTPSSDSSRELDEMLSILNGSGAHACYCPRSLDGGCTCALKDECVEEIKSYILAHFTPNEKIVEAIGKYQDPNTSGRGFKTGYVTRENKLRHEILQKLNLEQANEGKQL